MAHLRASQWCQVTPIPTIGNLTNIIPCILLSSRSSRAPMLLARQFSKRRSLDVCTQHTDGVRRADGVRSIKCVVAQSSSISAHP
eukprot:3135388-Prymnesium_polylepis.1